MCPGCHCTNHRDCVNVPEGVTVDPSWRCSAECPGKNELDMSITETMDTTSLNDTVYLNTSSENVPGSAIGQDLRELRDEIREARLEFRALRDDIVDLKALMRAYGDRLAAVETRVDAMEQRLTDGGSEGENRVVKEMEQTMSQLRRDLNDRDQDLLGNDIDIAGIPEERGENILHLIITCAAKIGVSLDERDVVDCTRVGAVKADDQERRPRVITVRLARRHTRDQVLGAARVRRRLTTEGLGLRSEARNVYINERLTRFNRALFNKARELGKKLEFKYVWTRRGRIYARRCQDDAAERLRDEHDLARVFGSL